MDAENVQVLETLVDFSMPPNKVNSGIFVFFAFELMPNTNSAMCRGHLSVRVHCSRLKLPVSSHLFSSCYLA